jgi:aflatoxin B1 aldehyde reductase
VATLLTTTLLTMMRAPTTVARLYLGTMTFGWKSQTSSYVDEETAQRMIERFLAHNDKYGGDGYVDTARIYAGGKTEMIVGKAVKKISSDKILIGTKAHPSQKGGLSKEGIQLQLRASNEAMGLTNGCLQEYYLHQPDPEHSLLESLQALHDLVLQGVIKSIGMSNYHASEMKRAFELCREHNLTPPTVFQGLYNPLNRVVEDELLPVLKSNGCAFVAYNPLAAGLLTGKHTDPDNAVRGRFKNNPNYLPRFYTQANFDAVNLIRQACEQEKISMVEATYRWLLRHSALQPTDGLLLGASSMKQLDQNLQACAAATDKGPLPDSILTAFEEAWKLTKPGAFPYWRSYSSDMPDRDRLDPGASYDAVKK